VSATVVFEIILLVPSAAIGVVVWLAAGGRNAGQKQRQGLKRY